MRSLLICFCFIAAFQPEKLLAKQHGGELDQIYTAAVARKLQTVIAKFPHGGDCTTRTAVVEFEINDRGRLAFVHILQSTGLAAEDRTAIRAIQSSEPFPKPPAGISGIFKLPVTFKPNRPPCPMDEM